MKIKRDNVLLILEWCKNKYKHSKFQDEYPEIILKRKEKDGILKGEFLDEINTIEIYPKHHSNLEDIIKTIIHEYQHYKQDPYYYTDFSEECEDKANQIMERDFLKCMKEIKKYEKIKIRNN